MKLWWLAEDQETAACHWLKGESGLFLACVCLCPAKVAPQVNHHPVGAIWGQCYPSHPAHIASFVPCSWVLAADDCCWFCDGLCDSRLVFECIVDTAKKTLQFIEMPRDPCQIFSTSSRLRQAMAARWAGTAGWAKSGR